MPTRRAFFGSAVAAGVAAGGPPIFTVPPASAIIAACTWAVSHRSWMNDAALDDAGMGTELGRVGAVFEQAIIEPSRDVYDLAAKARLLLDDLGHEGELDSPYANDRLKIVILRELVELGSRR